MVSIIHFIVFILIWPFSPAYIIYKYDIDSLFLQFLICGTFGLFAIIGSTLITMAISPQDREQFKSRWDADNKKS